MTIKQKICNYLNSDLDKKINEARLAIASSRESRDSDTKSSAGDKHETGRAMMQMEMEKNEVQLSNILNQQHEISKINPGKKYNQVEFGSLVITNQGNYFISIGYGKIVIENGVYYLISLASPIGSFMKGKITGDKIQFQGKEFIISDIV